LKARVLAAAVLIASPVLALAHQAGLSYGSFTLEKDRVDVVLRLPAAELFVAWPGAAAPGTVPEHVPEALAHALLATVAVEQRAGACASTLGACQLEAPDGVRLSATFRCPHEDEPVEIRLGFVARMLPGHVHVARALVGGSAEELVVDARHEAFRVEVRSSSWARAARFVRVGFEHIFSGWDHVAFLLGLLLASGRLRDVMRVVTSFTVGHAATLALATFGVVAPPAALIEPLIAASVVYVGVENLLELRRSSARPRRRWPIALAFGLVHGFGFAGALGELELERAGLAKALFSFNLGVELGQAAIVALAFPLLASLRRRPALGTAGLPVGSAMVGCAGLVWLVRRIPW
jgi:HupE / UreJ protein